MILITTASIQKFIKIRQQLHDMGQTDPADRHTSVGHQDHHSIMVIFVYFINTVTIYSGGASTPIGHWRSTSKTGTPTLSFDYQFLSQKL